MSRRRPDHSDDMTMRGDSARLRGRRRRRRLVRGAIRTVFWALVLTGVFILGIGYGRTLSSEDELRTDEVTITVPREAVTATLPTETITVTKTVRAKPAAGTGGQAGAGTGGN